MKVREQGREEEKRERRREEVSMDCRDKLSEEETYLGGVAVLGALWEREKAKGQYR